MEVGRVDDASAADDESALRRGRQCVLVLHGPHGRVTNRTMTSFSYTYVKGGKRCLEEMEQDRWEWAQ